MRNHGYIFVYGSLRVGGHFSHNFDEDRVSVRPAKVDGELYDLHSFPGLILGDKGVVHGELHLYKDFHFVVRHVDYIEGYYKRNDDNNLYNKGTVEVETEDGKKVKAIVYTLNTHRVSIEGCEIVEDGVWPL